MQNTNKLLACIIYLILSKIVNFDLFKYRK